MKNDRLIIGKIGLTNEILYYKEDNNNENELFYPYEYFYEPNEKIVNDLSYDIWSLGCVIYLILNNSNPFNNIDDIKNKNIPISAYFNQLIKK